MREVTQPRMLPLALLFCVLCTASWQQVSASCKGGINVAVAMDASQSLGKLNFLHVKAFTKSIAENLLTDNDEANFFAVAFARDVDVIVGDKLNVNDTIAAIDDFDKRLIAETNTNLAIDMNSQILKMKGDPYKPSVMFIVTDGRATSGLQVVTEAAYKAAGLRIVIVAIGVGNDFAYEELLSMTVGRREHVLNGTFANLNFEVLGQTLKTICHLSVTNPNDNTIERPTCETDGTIAIGVEVSSSLNEQVQTELLILLNMLSPGTYTALSNRTMITDFHRVTRFTRGSITDITTTAIPADKMLQNMIDKLFRQQTGQRIAVMIIDDTFWKDSLNLNKLISTKQIVERARRQDITVIALIVGRQIQGMEKVLESIFGTVNKLSVNSADMDSIVTSGFNQLLKRICTVLSSSKSVTTTSTTTTTPATTPQTIDSFGGALDVHITFDVCQEVPQNNVFFGTYGHFTALLAEKLVFGPSNVSLTASLTYCSGVDIIAQSREYIYESHYSLSWARDGSPGTVTATTIINDVIQRWDSTLGNVGIILITDEYEEFGLQSAVDRARTLNIMLMAVTLTASGAPSTAMAQKAAIIDAAYANMNFDELYIMPGIVKVIIQRIPSLFKEPVQTMIGITLDGTLSQQQLAGVDYALQNLQKMINSVITDMKYTQSLQQDLFNNLEVTRRANILRRIEYYSRVNTIQAPDFVVIITNRPPLDMGLITDAIIKASQTGVEVFLTGLVGDSGTPVESIMTAIDKDGSSIAILIDSSESVSKEDFLEAYKTSALLLWRLSSTVQVEVSTFDVNAHTEIPMTEYSPASRNAFVGKLYRMSHLMLKPPLYKAVEKMAQMSQENEDVRTVGVMFIADGPRYIGLLNLFRDYIYANQTTLVVVDISPGGDIEGLEQDSAFYPMHIIRAKNLELTDIPGQILDFMISTGYSKFHTVFTVGQIGSLEGNFPLFENMLKAFELAADGYVFSTDFGLITLENNAMFDFFNLSMDTIINILRRLMKVSDRGSESAIEFTTGMLNSRMSQTQKQGVSVIITDENPKFPAVVASKADKARDYDAKHTLVIGVGDNLNQSNLLSLNNVGDDDLCIASDGEDLRNSCVRWLVNKLRTLPKISPLQSSTEPTTTTESPFVPSVSPSVTTNYPPTLSSASTTIKPNDSTTNTPPSTSSTTTFTSDPHSSTLLSTTTSISTTTATTVPTILSTSVTSSTTPTTVQSTIATVPKSSFSNTAQTASSTTSQTTSSTTSQTTSSTTSQTESSTTAATSVSKTAQPSTTLSTTPTLKTAITTSSITQTKTTTSATSVSAQSTVTPTMHVCNGDAQVGIGVTSSLQVREVFEAFQENITRSVGDDVNFKFLFFYNSQLFEATTDLKSSDPKAFESVVEEVNARLTNLYTGRSNLITIIFTDGESAAGGISFEVFDKLSSYIEFVVFGIGQFNDAAIADMKRLTRNKPRSLIMVDNINAVDYDKSIAFLGNAVCDAVTKPTRLDIRTNITRICSNLPVDTRFGLDAENVWYPFDCTKFINCVRFGSSVRANVISCPGNTRFNTATKKCDISQDVECKEVTAEKYALEIGKIVDPPVPKVVNLTAECIDNCFKSEDLTDNYGYTYHPTNCSKFIVCRREGYINPGYTYTVKEEECPVGHFWDAQQKRCITSHLAKCAADLCRQKSLFAFWNIESCRHFYQCKNGKSRLRYCAYGKKFQSDGSCVQDFQGSCSIRIAQPTPCYNLPFTDSTMYVDRTIGDNGKLTSCPIGKKYEHNTCTCSKNYITGACQPVLSNMMERNMILNNVRLHGGIAYFFGLGTLTMPQPSPLTNTFLVQVVISLSNSNQDVVMLSSCPELDKAALVFRLINDQLTVFVKLVDDTVTLTSKLQFDSWNNVLVAYNGQKIVLSTGVSTTQVPATGSLHGCQNNYILGSNQGFYGEIDELNVYDCIPDQQTSLFN